MENIEKSGKKYITLKEASKISGYSQDYLGQLIRKGKLEGKQIYLNVAWMTTEEALNAYLSMSKSPAGKMGRITGIRARTRRWIAANTTEERLIGFTRKLLYIFIALLVAFCLFLLYALIANIMQAPVAHAAVGVPKILSYQGRLFDSGGNLLGGAGTAYCFRFSIFNASSGGSQLWPAATASIMTVNVQNGVFNVGIGDTSAGGDALTYDFQSNDTSYLDVSVATKVDPSCTGGSEVFEHLAPRPRIVASGYAINSYSVGGFTPSQNATGSQIPVLANGSLMLGDANPQINATGSNTLTLQGGGGTGAIQFFSANTFIASSGIFRAASSVIGSMLQATATSSQFVFRGTGATGTLSWNPTIGEALTIPDFGTGTDTVALANFSQTLANKTLTSPALTSPSVTGGMTILQNAAGTGLFLTQNATGTALAIVNTPTSTQSTSTVSIYAGANVAGSALIVQNFGTGNAFQVNDASSTVFAINSSGNAVFQPSNDTSAAFLIENASGTNTLFQADTLNNKIKIGDNGAAGTVPTLLGLDVKADAGDPTGFNGAMYYSSSTGSFRCDQGGTWYDCVPTNMDWQPIFFEKRWGYWAPLGTTATTLTNVNMVAPTATGTAAASAQAEDFYVQWTTGATNGAAGGETQAFTQTEARYTPRFATRIRTDTSIASRRIWVALSSVALMGTDATTSASTTVFIGLRYSTSANDTTWQCGSGDGTSISYVNTGVTVTTSTYYDILLDASTPGQLTCEVATNGGAYVKTVKSTNIPSSATNLGVFNTVTTLTTAAAVHRIAYVYLGSRE